MDYTATDATFDSTEKLRLTLRRQWKPGKTALVSMLNPSSGNGLRDDPTLRRLTEITDGLGFGGYTVVNWSPFISASPKTMMEFMNKDAKFIRFAMRKNIEVVKFEAKQADSIIVAWGNDFPTELRGGDLLSEYTSEFLSALMLVYKNDLMCFGITKLGAPKHPLARGKHRIGANIKLMPWIGR